MNKELSEILNLLKNKKLAIAEKKCSALIKKIDENFEIFNIYAVILFQLKKYEEAIIQWEKAINLNPKYYFGYNNLGSAYFEINKFDRALQNFNKALQINDKYFEAFYNRGNVFFKLNDLNKALENYQQSVFIKSDYIPAIQRKAVIFKKLEKFDEAIREWDKLISLSSNEIHAYFQKGDLLFAQNKLEEALISYENAYLLDSEKSFLFGSIIHTKAKMCEWTNYNENIEELKTKIINNKKIATPYTALTLYDDPSIHLKTSKIWLNFHEDENLKNKNSFLDLKKNEKIKIGYYSSDFRTHAMGHLLVGLFELHDKSKFEIYGFYFGPKIKKEDLISKRIIKCFDRFEDVSLKNDQDVANLSRDLEIDIAVDLMCFTGNSNRFGIFSKKCAPLQINFLGYPGTSGSEYIDYIIADKKLITPENEKFFSEKIIFLPDTYQPNEKNKKVSQKYLTRYHQNLPENHFIFASFNSHQKITPEMFGVWMNILNKKKESIIWLLKDNNISEKNLKKEALKNGVDGDRLIFAEHLKLEEHLNRFKFVDLFLDTFPYNAHTTCSDALRMNVPVLTKKGLSFASRVASSLLSTINLTELITTNNNDYEELAIKIANDPYYSKELKIKIEKNKEVSSLFKTELFTTNLESGYKKVYNNFINGLKPSNIEL